MVAGYGVLGAGGWDLDSADRRNGVRSDVLSAVSLRL
jgi:hypothetical protein